MNLKDLIERRNKTMADAGALAQKGFINAEDRSKFDTMVAAADVDTADITRMEQVERFTAEQQRSTRPPRAGFGNEDRSEERTKNEKRALFEWMRHGQVSPENRDFIRTPFERRDLGAGAIAAPITGGNVLVPTGFDPTFHAALLNYGEIVGAVNSINTGGGGPINVATENDTGQGLTLISEAATASEIDPTVAGFQSFTDTATSGVVTISNQLLQDSQFDLESWIGSKLGTRYYRGLSEWIAQGNGSNVAALGSTAGVTTAAAGAITYTDLVGLYGSLGAAYAKQGSFVMTSATRANLMEGLISTTGQPILQTDPVSSQPFSSLFGRPIVISEYQQSMTTAGNKPILFGDLKEGYTLRTVGSFGIRRLQELFALQDMTAFVLFCRVGGYNIDAGTHPVRSLTMHA